MLGLYLKELQVLVTRHVLHLSLSVEHKDYFEQVASEESNKGIRQSL